MICLVGFRHGGRGLHQSEGATVDTSACSTAYVGAIRGAMVRIQRVVVCAIFPLPAFNMANKHKLLIREASNRRDW